MSQTPDLDKIKKTLLKVKELAERGENGERVSAQVKLETLLSKYNLDISELQSENPVERSISHHRDADARTILVQVIMSITNENVFITKGKYVAHAKLTSEQYIEVVEKYKYFWRLYLKQKKIFMRAFVTKNKLFAINPENIASNISNEDRNDVARMMMSIEKGEFSTKEQKLLDVNSSV